MDPKTRRVLREALQLPAKARADIAGMLLRSLDAREERGVDEAWAAEVARRVADTDAGRVELMPWHRARRRLTVGPSKRSLREIPEVDVRTAPATRNPYARRIAAEGLVVQVGRGRPMVLFEPGRTLPRSKRLSNASLALLAQRARAEGLTLRVALRQAILEWARHAARR